METTIQKHQAEFNSVHTRFDNVKNQALHTMAACQASSKSLLNLRTESLQQLNELRTESATAMKQLREETAANQKDLQDQLERVLTIMTQYAGERQSPPASLAASADNSSTGSDSSSSMSTSHYSTGSPMQFTLNIQSNTEQLTLPPVKKKEQKKRSATESNSTDQASAQYNPPRAPDGRSL